MSLNAPCLHSHKPTPTLWVCVWSLKTSPVKELILPPSTPIKRTPPSSSSNPPRATSGMNARLALENRAGRSGTPGFLLASLTETLTVMSSWCAAFPHNCLFDNTECVWQISGVCLWWHMRGLFFCCVAAVSHTICISECIWHSFVMALGLILCVCVRCVLPQWGQDDHSDGPGFRSGAERYHAGGGSRSDGE